MIWRSGQWPPPKDFEREVHAMFERIAPREPTEDDWKGVYARLLGLTIGDVGAIRVSCDDLPITIGAHPYEAELRCLADRIAGWLAPQQEAE